MLGMLMEISTEDIPGTTQLVMNISAWLGSNGVALFVFIALIVGVIVFYAKTFGQMRMSKLAKDFPLIGRVIQNNSMVSFFRNWQQMILAGAEMSVALKSAAEAIPNRYIRREAMRAQHDYEENGIAVHEALRTISCLKALELQTIHVAMEGDRLPKVLGILAEDRELEAQKSINAMTAAVNPILMVIVGLIVGTLVLAIYQPIISVSSSLS